MHTKALAVDGKLVIVGSMNFDFSSWLGSDGLPNLINLAEYNLAIEAPAALTTYDTYFEQLWTSNRRQIRVGQPASPRNRATATTLQTLVDQALPHYILILPEGIYRESVVIDKPLQVVGLHGGKTVITAPLNQPAFRIEADEVMLYHLTVQSDHQTSVIQVGPHHNIHLRKLLLIGPGLHLDQTTRYTIENNTFIGGDYGIQLNGTTAQTPTSLMRNNLFWGQNSPPIQINSATDGGVAYRYNLFNLCAQAEQGVCPTAWYSGSLSHYSTVSQTLLNVDPQFGQHYTLLATSPAIDGGDPSSELEMGLDGQVPGRADIGAFERELVIEPPRQPHQESQGQLRLDAETFTNQSLGQTRSWQPASQLPGYRGLGYMIATPDAGFQVNPTNLVNAPWLQYQLHFTTHGTYYVWVRGYAPNGAGDSLYLGWAAGSALTITGFAPRQWSWTNQTDQPSPAQLVVDQPGVYTLQVWMREDGLRLDELFLTTDATYIPEK